MDLYISSGYHITRPQKRINAIEDQFENVDVVFVEAPLSDNPKYSSILLNLVSAPLLMPVMYSWIVILYLSDKIFSSNDGVVIDHFEDTHQSEVVQTDINMNRLVAKNRRLWIIGHACIMLICVLAVPRYMSEMQFDSVLFALVTLLALAGAAIFVHMLAAVDPVRNRTMADDILQRAKESPDDQAVLVVGGDHKEAVVNLLQEESEVDILNPK